MAFNLKDDPRMQQRLQGAVGLLTPKDIDAPFAELPPLGDIIVKLPAPDPPSDVEILARYRERLRDISKITPKKRGDEIGYGDEVSISTVGHINGALFAGSIKHEHWIEMVPDASLPGFVEQIVGLPVGGAAVVPVVLEKAVAAIAVRILEAQTVDMPDPETAFSVLGLAPTLDATLEKLGLELLAEAEQATPLRAMHAAMEALSKAAVVDVPASAVDAEIQRVWKLAEGDACVALGLTVEEQQEALKLWLTNAGVRDEALMRLKNWGALKTVCVRDKLDLTEQGWARFFESFAPSVGKSPAEARAEVERDPRVKAELEELAFRMQVVDHVLAHMQITVVD